MTDHSLQRLIAQTEADLGSLLPHLRDRLKKRLVLAYWQGVHDAQNHAIDPAAERRTTARNLHPQLPLGIT